MNVDSDIKNRTFGIEIEMCNLERAKVSLPEGYAWSKDENIDNTDCSCNKQFGGEVNTPPLHLCSLKDLHGLRSVYESMVAAGGRLKWSIDTHVHIYVGDLSVDQLKKVYLFYYVCYPYFKRYAKISDWDENIFNAKPRPTEKYYNGVLQAQTLEDIQKLFTNNSHKGYIRHAVNISAYFKTKTIEFRMFHATDDFYMAMNCVYSAYRVFYYALSHKLEDYLSITSYQQFCEVTGLKYATPEELCPLLYQGNPYNAIEAFMTAPLPYNSSMASALYDAVKANGHKDICVVNGFMYYYELFFLDKMDVTIYCQDAYCHLLYMLANGKTSLTYKGKLAWLEDYNNPTPSRQLALALYAVKLQKYLMSTSARNNAILEALKAKAKESIEKTEKSNERLIRLLTTCDFHVGTLEEAIRNEKVVFFNYGRTEKNQKRAFKLISENSDLECGFHVARNDYYNLVESIPSDSYFYYFSNSPYLRNLHKIALWDSSTGERRTAGRYLYCNKPIAKKIVNTSYSSFRVECNEIVPPDDLEINNPDLLKIEVVSAPLLKYLQRKYIKKVDQVSSAVFPFVVKYDKYTLGGFGFTLSKHDKYDLFQITDFCTNNAIPRLSKLILYCVLSVGVQKYLNRRMHKFIDKVISLAYTHKPVSMKYRGVYKKVKEHCTPSYLAYEGELGLFATNKEIIEKYKKSLKNGK